MKPREKKPETVYRIIDKKTGKAQGSYSRACCDEYDFSSVESARTANCHNMFRDKDKYKIAKYKVTYELINDDCDNAGEYDEEKMRKKRQEDIEAIEKYKKISGKKKLDALDISNAFKDSFLLKIISKEATNGQTNT